MPSSAIALVRSSAGWRGTELDLDGVEDLDALADVVRDFAGDDTAPAVAFVEENDEYLAIVRLTGGDDPRVFLSDRRVIATSDLAERLFDDALPVAPVVDDDDEGLRPDADPAGDAELLADLGTPGDVLVELLTEGGALPADVVTALAERAGAADALDRAREG